MAYANAARPLPEDDIARYVLDDQASNFVVQVFATGLLAAFGHSPKIAIRKFSGEAEFTQIGATLEDVQLRLQIDASSLEVTDDISDKDRQQIHQEMRSRVLQTDRYPEIEYECSTVSVGGSNDRFWVALSGSLTLCGETHPQLVNVRVTVNGDSLRASGEFAVKQSDYGIALVSVAGGTIRLKDEVKCTFDIVARKRV